MDGILLCNKPEGITSNKIARNIAKKFNIKVGNTGILDLAAEGLLILVIGKGTKFTQYFQNLDKEYFAIGELGKETDTYDKNGDIINESPININKESLEKIIKSFEGKISLIPPSYSSKKINGKRAYKYALKGEEIHLKPIEVEIYSIDIIDINLPFFSIKVNCSSGTYIRSLIKEIGIKSRSYAYMCSLKRTKIGDFSINDSIDYDLILQLDINQIKEKIIPLEKALYFFQSIKIEKEQINKFKNGQKIILNLNDNSILDKKLDKIIHDNSLIKILDSDGKLIGLGKMEENLKIQPVLVF